MQSDSSTWVVLARLLRPQGRRGELLAELLTDFPERLAGRQDLFLTAPGSTEDLSAARRIEITSSWLPVGKNKGRVVLHLAGIDTISQAEQVAGLDVVVSDDRRTPLEDDDSVYISDLVGCTLFDGADAVGQVSEVQFPSALDGIRVPDAAPLLVVTTGDGEEVLIPFAKAFVKSLDLPDRRIVMSLPVGLVDINRPN
ncbi:MAG TPA: ribosome maturation factor RimM [Edaphobacter sp.]|nr:ribosome maturation factor RimM [Edaphobacter sp.]